MEQQVEPVGDGLERVIAGLLKQEGLALVQQGVMIIGGDSQIPLYRGWENVVAGPAIAGDPVPGGEREQPGGGEGQQPLNTGVRGCRADVSFFKGTRGHTVPPWSKWSQWAMACSVSLSKR